MLARITSTMSAVSERATTRREQVPCLNLPVDSAGYLQQLSQLSLEA